MRSDKYVKLYDRNIPGAQTHAVRIVGLPVCYMRYSTSKKTGPMGTRVAVRFPDHDINKSFYRFGDANDIANCPWHQAGYDSYKRWAYNVICEDNFGNRVVKILDCGTSIATQIAEFEQNNINLRRAGKQAGPTLLGGRDSQWVEITATQKYGQTGHALADYRVSVGQRDLLSPADIVALIEAGLPSTEEIAEMRASYQQMHLQSQIPFLPEWEDWFVYGHPLYKIYAPSPYPVTEAPTATPTHWSHVPKPNPSAPLLIATAIDESFAQEVQDDDEAPIF